LGDGAGDSIIGMNAKDLRALQELPGA